MLHSPSTWGSSRMTIRLYDWHHLETVVDQIANNVIHQAFPRDWHEDYITRSLLSRLRDQLGTVELFADSRAPIIHWDVFKLHGNAEKCLGDIGVIVDIQFPGAPRIAGVALLEAKKFDPQQGRFAQLKAKQLQRIAGKAPKAHVLLYDSDSTSRHPVNAIPDVVTRPTFLRDYGPCASKSYAYWLQTTHATCVPISTTRQLMTHKNRTLYNFGISFGGLLCMRHLNGFDLEFEKRACDIVRGFAENVAGPKYVLAATIRSNHAPIEDSLESMGLNLDMYTPLKNHTD